jgi:tRNA modification GTPase
VEQEGVRRARSRAAEADLVLWLTDRKEGSAGHRGGAPVWLVRNKSDLGIADPISPGSESPSFDLADAPAFWISAKGGDGIAGLVAALIGFAQDFFGANEGALITRERQRNLLQATALSLRGCIAAIGQGEELAAEDLRAAATALGRLLGRVDVEDVLDVIFREFCIGK